MFQASTGPSLSTTPTAYSQRLPLASCILLRAAAVLLAQDFGFLSLVDQLDKQRVCPSVLLNAQLSNFKPPTIDLRTHQSLIRYVRSSTTDQSLIVILCQKLTEKKTLQVARWQTTQGKTKLKNLDGAPFPVQFRPSAVPSEFHMASYKCLWVDNAAYFWLEYKARDCTTSPLEASVRRAWTRSFNKTKL